MSYNWDGLMVLFGDKYGPTWVSDCPGLATVNGVMEVDGKKYKPIPDAYGICTAEEAKGESQMMVLDVSSGKYFPRVIKTNQTDCCASECSGCTPSIFSVTGTPYKVTATVSGITECAGKCSESFIDFTGDYEMTQLSSDYPCAWYYTGTVGGTTVYMRWLVYHGAPPRSYFHIWTNNGAGDVDAYYGKESVFCSFEFFDGFDVGTCCGGDVWWGMAPGAEGGDPQGEFVAYGGTVTVTWT